jgi:DNA-directed RNA polymerase specialized sigma24 family protein/ribosome-associated translation inhibitor RaiA
MNVHISYKISKTPDIEREITHLVEKLQIRLRVFRPELVHLKGSLERNSEREGTSVALNLRLPSGQMAVQESAPNAVAAIKAGLDDLLQQLKKHKDLLRSRHKWARRRSHANGHLPQVPFEETFAAVAVPTVSADDVRSYVNVNLGRLDRFVAREIFFRESADQLIPDSLSKEEVIDEVIARALEDGEKPQPLALEPWLYRLALRSVDDLSRCDGDGSANVRLESSARKPNVRASDEAELQFHQPDETLTEESVIADQRVATPEDIAATDELVSLIQRSLLGSKREDREALILYAMEGFTVEEISAITERKCAAVRDSIAAARKHVRAAPLLSGRFFSRPHQSTGTE